MTRNQAELAGLNTDSTVSIAIPTFNRGAALLDTIAHLGRLESQPLEILVIDQTAEHPPAVEAALDKMSAEGAFRWLRMAQPSIPRAMNQALREARGALVLFLDDDIVPLDGLVAQHEHAHQADASLWATVGQVIQPWQTAQSLRAPRELDGLMKDFDFPFHSDLDAEVENVMAGNLCVHRQRALSLGGFDQNFIGAAYRFESDFARRVVSAGGKIRFIGKASIRHLHLSTGGTRDDGNHLTSASPRHGFGDYYYAFQHGRPSEAWGYSVRRMLREVRTRFHLTHPWWIPVKLTGEVRALVAARKTVARANSVAGRDVPA